MPKPGFHKRTRPDRLTAAELAQRKHAFEVDELLKPVTRRKRDADQKWGVDRLPELVPTEWAQKFGKALQGLEDALGAEPFDPNHVRGRAENLIKGYNKLDEIAEASGAARSPELLWHLEVSGKPAILALDRASQFEAIAQFPERLVFSIDEIERLLEARGMELVEKTKELWPGAEAVETRPRERTALEKSLEDEIPF